jgi:ribosomal protein L3
MSQIISPNGDAIPVTYVEVEDNNIIQIKTKDKD